MTKTFIDSLVSITLWEWQQNRIFVSDLFFCLCRRTTGEVLWNKPQMWTNQPRDNNAITRTVLTVTPHALVNCRHCGTWATLCTTSDGDWLHITCGAAWRWRICSVPRRMVGRRTLSSRTFPHRTFPPFQILRTFPFNASNITESESANRLNWNCMQHQKQPNLWSRRRRGPVYVFCRAYARMRRNCLTYIAPSNSVRPAGYRPTLKRSMAESYRML